MKKYFLCVFLLLVSVVAYSAETPRWEKVVNQTSTAATYTSHWDKDSDGYESSCDGVGVEVVSTCAEVTKFMKFIVTNRDATDTAWCDANSNTSGTQNTAVNDGSRPTSLSIPPGFTVTFRQSASNSQRSTISCICAAGQTCDNLTIKASND